MRSAAAYLSSAWQRVAQFRPSARLLKRSALLVLAALGAAVLAVGCLATYRPAWFTAQAVDYNRLRSDKRALSTTLDEIGDALNAGRPIELRLRADQLNRWLAAREELPEAAELRLPGLQHPQVHLLPDNRLRVAAEVERGGFRFILSSVLVFEHDPQRIRIRVESTRIGALPLPPDRVLRQAGPQLRRLLRDTRSLTRRNEFVWFNGRRPFTISALALNAELATLTLTPR